MGGKEVVELYTSAPKSNIEKPACEFKAFAKTKLFQPVELEVVTMNFAIPDLASFDEISNSWITDAGTYQIKIGSSVQDIRQTILLKINKRLVKKSLAKL
jgi:beta-glucosidase